MANAFMGEAPLNLSDGRSLTLRLDMLAMFTAEELAGLAWDKMMERLRDRNAPKMRITAAIITAMLSFHQPEKFDLEAVANLMADDGDALVEGMNAAMKAAFAGKAAANPRKGAARAKAPSRGTGTRSPKPGRPRG